MNEKGITLIALALTIAIAIIIAGVSITIATIDKKEMDERISTTELSMVGEAVLETRTKYELVNEEAKNIGDQISETMYKEIDEILQHEGLQLIEAMEQYVVLIPGIGLKTLGITNTQDTYVVNFNTGEVFNYTKQRTKKGTLLYLRAYSK